MAARAAVAAGVAGQFRAWQQAGVMAVLATEPTLSFLAVVSGVSPRTLPAAISLAQSAEWGTAAPTVLSASALDTDVGASLRGAGFSKVGDSVLAIRQLDESVTAPLGSERHRVIEAPDATDDAMFADGFVQVLLSRIPGARPGC